jgi:uncharacterized protein YegP (UPF0339 family)
MAKTQALPVPRVEATKNRKGEFNYRMIGKNSRILYSCNQGFKRKDRLLDNLIAVARIMNVQSATVRKTAPKDRAVAWISIATDDTETTLPVYFL